MALNIEEKKDVVGRLRSRALSCPSLALIDARGLDAASMLALRSMARSRSCSVSVAKNTLARRAWDGTPMASAQGLLTGSLAHVYGQGEEPAKIAAEFAKGRPSARVAGGFYAGAALDGPGVASVAALPTKQELLARLAYALAEPARSLARAIAALAEQGGAAPAAAPALV